MVRARQRLILEFLSQQKPRRVLEIGCGPVLLYAQACRQKLPIREWVIVEPCQKFLDRIRAGRIGLKIFPGFFEKSCAVLKTNYPEGFDVVICSGMLNEVKHPQPFLKKMKDVLAQRGIAHINVPHAGSLHRRLGKAMGLIKDLAQASSRNRRLLQYHVFDRNSLHQVVRQSGLVIVAQGGYFLKPFSHTQMLGMRRILTPKILEGLWQLGREFPELATEIFVNVRRR